MSFGLSVLFFAISTAPGLSQGMTIPGSFGVSASGSATYRVPISVPPATAGMAPTLSLEYSSQGANGLLGVGWSLGGLPSISRCPRTLAQDGVVGGINYDANDRFCMDGQRLVAVSGAYGADGAQYRTEIDGFSKVISHGVAGNGPAWFEVHTKSGQTMEFGNTTDSRILAQGKSTARNWSVNKVSDTKTNYYTVTYTNDTSNGQYYPTRIDYTGNVSASVAPYNSVQFFYQTRPDVVPAYRAGSLSQTTVRMTNVKTYTNGTVIGDYRLTYQQNGAANRTRMTSVAACDGSGSCLPATTMSWTSPISSFGAPTMWSSCYSFNCGWSDNNTYPRMVVDVNGDGLPDVVGFASTGVYVSLNTGTSFGAAQQWNNCYGTGCGWSDNATYPRTLIDVNGDRLPDVVGFAAGGVYVSLNTGTSFAPAQLWNSAFGNNTGWTDNNVTPRVFADVNGDGLPDLVGFGSGGVYVALNTGTSFATGQFWIIAFGSGGGWSDNNAYPRMLVDVNGDGLPDIVGFSSGGVYVSLNTGSGFAPAQVWIVDYGRTTGGWSDNNTYPRTLIDVNGDGLPDVVGFATGGVYVSLNKGTSFAPAQLWNSGFGNNSGWSNNSMYPRILADVNGDGLPDVIGFASSGVYVSLNTGTSFAAAQVWVGGYGSGTGAGGWVDENRNPRTMVDVGGFGYGGIVGFADAGVYVSAGTASAPLDFLSSVTSGLGVTTSVSYVPATNKSVVTKGTRTTFPTMDVIAPLYVVSRVDSSNGIGGSYSSIYTYYGARLDMRGRGFLGFAQISVKDIQTNILETTAYRQDFPHTGLVASTVRTLGGLTLGQSTNTYQFSNAGGGTTINPSSAPYRLSLSQRVSSGADLDGSVLPTTTSTYQYDSYNNPTKITVSTSDGYSKTTTNTYTNDVTNWYLGRLTRASVTSVAP